MGRHSAPRRHWLSAAGGLGARLPSAVRRRPSARWPGAARVGVVVGLAAVLAGVGAESAAVLRSPVRPVAVAIAAPASSAAGSVDPPARISRATRSAARPSPRPAAPARTTPRSSPPPPPPATTPPSPSPPPAPAPAPAPQPAPPSMTGQGPVVKTVAGRWARPSPGVYTSCFCARWGTFHYGIDLADPLGTPIYAAGDGVVLQAGPAAGFGNWVVIQHANGDVTIYGHMRYFSVHAGQRVSAGQQIAVVGAEGDATGPHLHFGVMQGRFNGPYVDPVPWLAARGISVGAYNPNG